MPLATSEERCQDLGLCQLLQAPSLEVVGTFPAKAVSQARGIDRTLS